MVSTISQNDRRIVRDLARRYLDVCRRPEQDERRALWRAHNSLEPTRPLIYVRAFAWRELEASRLECEDGLCRHYENFFRQHLCWDSYRDDSIFEPWVTVGAARHCPPGGVWGMSVEWVGSNVPGGSRAMRPPIVEPEDAKRLATPRHEVDEDATARARERVEDLLGDILPVVVDRSPIYRTWNGDISTQIAQLRGIDHLMLDMVERPEWLHEVLAHMRDGILKTHEEAERAGHWTLTAHQNQAMPYAKELADPAPSEEPVPRSDLWYFSASQETTLIGPAQFDEFMYQYQMPIMEPFALTAYGCCEDLTQKIDVVRQAPNLRRIAVSPMADAAACAEQIGRDYVLSYRPSPSDMVGYSFSPERIRRVLREDLAACRDTHVDITLKDVETVQGDPTRVPRWVEITREVIDEIWSRDVAAR